MLIKHSVVLVAVLMGAACSSEEVAPAEEKSVGTAAALPNIPLPPDGLPIGTEGQGEAMQILVSTPLDGDKVAEFYRGVLGNPPFTLMSDNTQGETTSFYVEQDGPPLWVNVERLSAGGTLVRLTGAAVDQIAKVATQDSTDSSEDSPSPN